MSMYEILCANPECPNPNKKLYTFAKNRLGEVPKVYCSNFCRGIVKNKEKYVDRKRA